MTTNQDYGRMLDTWEQRVRRDRIKLSKISFPVPPRSHDELADRLLGRSHRRRRSSTSATSRTSPVRSFRSSASATKPGVAVRRPSSTARTHSHTFRTGHPISAATSTAPACTSGCSPDEIPLRPRADPDTLGAHAAGAAKNGDIRKEIGTHPAANHNAIAEALAFHEGIGTERKAARVALPEGSVGDTPGGEPESADPHQLDPAHSCAIGTVQITGIPTQKVVERLWARWRIIATPIVHAGDEGARITPNVYTTLEEIDTFSGAMEEIAKKVD